MIKSNLSKRVKKYSKYNRRRNRTNKKKNRGGGGDTDKNTSDNKWSIFRNYRKNPLTSKEQEEKNEEFKRYFSPLNKGKTRSGYNIRSTLFGKNDCNSKYINGLLNGNYYDLNNDEKEREFNSCCNNYTRLTSPPYCRAMKQDISEIMEQKKKDEIRKTALNSLGLNNANAVYKDESDESNSNDSTVGGRRRKRSRKHFR